MLQVNPHTVYEAFKVSPPVAYFGTILAGFSISKGVSILTGIYTILLIISQLRKIYKTWKYKHAEKELD